MVYLDFLIEQVSLCTSADKLRPQDVPLSHDQLVLFLEFPLLAFILLYDRVQLLDVVQIVFNLLVLLLYLFLEFLDLLRLLLYLLVLLLVLAVLMDQLQLLVDYLLVQLGDLVVHHSIPPLVLLVFFLDLCQILLD